MRTIELQVYSFEELSDEAKHKALASFRTINVDFDWWDVVYEDAKTAGLEIHSFDCDALQMEIAFVNGAEETAEFIKTNHGENCDTRKAAEAFLFRKMGLVFNRSDGVNTDRVAEGKEEKFDAACDILESEFTNSLRRAYLKMLDAEYDYQVSDEAVKETIIANEYEFTEDGRWYRG